MPTDSQQLGAPIPNWQGATRPTHKTLSGRFCRLEPLNTSKHAADLYAANALDTAGLNWTYLPYGPFASLADYCVWLDKVSTTTDPLFFAIIDLSTDEAVGVASYLRIDPQAGTIEVGHLNFSPRMQRSVLATEAMWLMMREAFSLGYRRYEWKCNALNHASRQAAQRLGLSFEGVFRQANVIKGRNRDTAWYAAIDAEWPALNQAFCAWLAEENFDHTGQQKISLSSLTSAILVQRG